MIRAATWEDAAAIAAVQIDSWRAAYAGILPESWLAGMSLEEYTGFWQRLMNGNENSVLAAVEDDKVVGWISGGDSRDSGSGEVSEVYAIYIAPAFQGKGLGRCLMRGMEKRFPVFRDITLWVFARNLAAQSFYRREGYEFDGTRQKFQLGGADLEELRFRKKSIIPGPGSESAPGGRQASFRADSGDIF